MTVGYRTKYQNTRMILVVVVLALTPACLPSQNRPVAAKPLPAVSKAAISPAGRIQELGLGDCLNLALRNNYRRPASKFAIAIAEAQHRQALAAYWPQHSLKGSYQRLDESPNFLFPAGSMQIPAQSIHVPGGVATVTIPAGAFGNPVPIQLPVAYPGQTFDTPAQHVKLMDPSSFVGALAATWLLYDGGLRKGYREPSQAFIEAMGQEARRTELEITDSVKRPLSCLHSTRQLLEIYHQLPPSAVTESGPSFPPSP